MEKILINKRPNKTRVEIVLVEGICKKINEKLIPEFNKLNVGEFTSNLLDDALFNQSSKIINLLTKQANDELKSVKNVAIKSVYENAIKEQKENFLKSSYITLTIEEELLIKYVTIVNGTAVPIEGYKDQIKEDNFYYIESEQEKALYDALSKIADGINEFNSSLGETVKNYVTTPKYYDNFLIINQNGLFQFDTDTDVKFLAK